VTGVKIVCRRWRALRRSWRDEVVPMGFWESQNLLFDSVPLEDFTDFRLSGHFISSVNVGVHASVNHAHAHALAVLMEPREMFRIRRARPSNQFLDSAVRL
jgi:hypothetical protein